jgi:glutamyl-tRNA reductase
MKALEAHFEAERQKALADAGGDAAKATRLLVYRLLQGPKRALDPASREARDAAALVGWVERLFGLKGSEKETK